MTPVNGTSSHHDAAISEFNSLLQSLTVTAECGGKFILVEKLKAWLESEDETYPRRQIDRLARAVYREFLGDSIHPMIDESVLLRSCPLTFCILVELGHGCLIHQFSRHHLVDQSLATMDSDTLRSQLKRELNLQDEYQIDGVSDLAERFDKLRWKYFTNIFDLRQDEFFSKTRILPIVRKQEINAKGGTAKLYRIEVPEEFVSESLREEVRNSIRDTKDGKRYVFALKTFEECNKPRFVNETRAFNGLRKHNGMVKYLAKFEREEIPPKDRRNGEHECRMTYNILLQYGDCDLTEYFIQTYPPLFPSDLYEFWQDLFEVAVTVKGIHTIEAETDETYLGWHADIKPDNILLVQDKFKLADPGFMKFVLDQSGSTREAVEEVIEGGTRTYGAPEMHSQANFPVSQTIDTWSLGCVFSIAATWIVAGLQGVAMFTKIRSDAVKELHHESDEAHMDHGDQFHNGEQVLDAVKDWHKFLRDRVRKTDHITSNLLDIVDDYMLVTDPGSRDKAGPLCDKLDLLLQNARKAGPQVDGPDTIMGSFRTAEGQGTMIHVPIEAILEQRQRPTGSEERKVYKSEVLKLVVKNTARPSSAFRRGLQERPEKKNPPLDRAASQEKTVQPVKAAQTRPIELAEDTKRPSRLSIVHKERKQSTLHNRLNVFDAREALEPEGAGVFQKILKPKRADDIVSDHYKERDIVFLVDNAGSMDRHWSQLKHLLSTLYLMMSRQHDVGMRLLLTKGSRSLSPIKKEGDVKKFMSSDEVRPQPTRWTDMEASLGDLFDDRIESVKRPHGKKRALTLIVLTDGIWQGTSKKSVVKARIAKFVKEITVYQGQHRKRPVSIQFIQFGNDIDARFFLQHLDDHLGDEAGVEDVIDFEPAEGDVRKMLLGSFVEAFDMIEPEAEIVGSPEPLPGDHGSSHA